MYSLLHSIHIYTHSYFLWFRFLLVFPGVHFGLPVIFLPVLFCSWKLFPTSSLFTPVWRTSAETTVPRYFKGAVHIHDIFMYFMYLFSKWNYVNLSWFVVTMIHLLLRWCEYPVYVTVLGVKLRYISLHCKIRTESLKLRCYDEQVSVCKSQTWRSMCELEVLFGVLWCFVLIWFGFIYSPYTCTLLSLFTHLLYLCPETAWKN